MIPSKAIRVESMALLAADPTTLAPVANAIFIGLVKTAFVPSETLVLSDLTLADFDGHTEIPVTLGAQAVANDPLNGDSVIDLSPPVGGFRWQTTGMTNLPETIYGYVLLDHAKAVILASALLPAPVTLTNVGQRIDDLIATIRLPPNTMY
jgi:hypothetical protein